MAISLAIEYNILCHTFLEIRVDFTGICIVDIVIIEILL